MRQLAEEGWMHNRVRMITAMFLTKDLLIDWRFGEEHFAKHLIDLDFRATTAGGSGAHPPVWMHSRISGYSTLTFRARNLTLTAVTSGNMYPNWNECPANTFTNHTL